MLSWLTCWRSSISLLILMEARFVMSAGSSICLTATISPVLRSRQRKTLPKPPSAISSRISMSLNPSKRCCGGVKQLKILHWNMRTILRNRWQNQLLPLVKTDRVQDWIQLARIRVYQNVIWRLNWIQRNLPRIRGTWTVFFLRCHVEWKRSEEKREERVWVQREIVRWGMRLRMNHGRVFEKREVKLILFVLTFPAKTNN